MPLTQAQLDLLLADEAAVEAAQNKLKQDLATLVVDLPPGPPIPTSGYQPTITGEAQPEQYITWDDGTGPNYAWWNSQLGIKWKNQTTGDFTDANDVPQGSVPFTVALVPALGWKSFDVTTLVKRAQVKNKGFYLKTANTSADIITIAGRITSTPPTLTVTTDQGQFNCPCLSNATWQPLLSTSTPINSQTEFTLSTSWRGIVKFDLTNIQGTVISATMQLNVTKRFGNPFLQIFEADPPVFQLGAGTLTPVPGLAVEVGEANLATHPDVYMAGDFAGTTVDFARGTANVPKLFGKVNVMSAPPEILPDPNAPGTFMWRGSFVPLVTGQDPRRQAFDGTKMLMFPDLNDPLRPPINVVDEAYYRMYILLENDFQNTMDGAKMGITWDLRMGYWANGYWQNTTGNGGLRGDGKRHRQTIAGLGDRYVYQGHMERMESGIQPLNTNPYVKIKPLQGYNYHIDQAGPYPGGWPVTNDELGGPVYGNIVSDKFTIGRPVCIEQHLKMNSIDLSVVDSEGNGVARPDGLLETWIDGILVDRRTTYRWRHHPQMGICQVNSNWYLGGRQPNTKTMHFTINHVVLAKRYIGPRVV